MAQILRVSVRGTLPGGEVWSVNPCWEINGATGDPVSPAQAQTIATALGGVAIPAGILAGMAPHTAVTGYRVEARALDGTLENQAEYVRPAPAVGNGSDVLPLQTAVCVSLRTPLPGARYRGRLYWPLTGETLGTATSRIGGSRVTTLLAGFKTLLSAYEAAINATLPLANLTVWSRVNAGFANVNNLQVGDVVDIQRRRRDMLVEAYQSNSYP